MLTEVPTSGRHEGINNLNALIKEYNRYRPDDGSRAVVLAQIYANSALLFQVLHEARNPNHLNRDIENYLNWYPVNQIAQELKLLGKPAYLGLTAEKSFMQLAADAPQLPNSNQWKRATASAKSWVGRREYDAEIDSFLDAVSKAKGNAERYDALMDLYYAVLNLLNQKMITVSDITKKRFRTLLSAIYHELDLVTNAMPEKMAAYKAHQAISSRLLGEIFYGGDRQAIYQFAGQLNNEQVLTIGDGFHAEKMGGIGGNNKDWLATHAKDGSHFLIRLMSGDDIKPATIAALYDNPEIAKYLTKEYMVCAAGFIPSYRLDGNYMISVSEFCANGDLMAHRRQLDAGGNADIIYLKDALKKTVQVGTFITTLLAEGYCYPDIKAENFLVADNGDVVTSDLKFIRNIEAGILNKGDNFNTTYPYAAPEYARAHTVLAIDMDKFASYQLGVMLYDLLTGKEGEEKLTWVTALKAATENPDIANPSVALSFGDSIFQSPRGRKAVALIQSSMQADVTARPSVVQFTAQIQAMNQQALNMREQMAALKSSTTGSPHRLH